MHTSFHTIGIIGKTDDVRIANTLNALYRHLRKRFYLVWVDHDTAQQIEDDDVHFCAINQMAERCDLLVAVGGDGTFLTAARAIAGYDIPLIGINLGRLGFLVDISPQPPFVILDQILAGRYKEEKRYLLQAQIVRDGVTIHQQTAVNEVVVHRWVTPSMIEIITHIDGVYLNTQRSDGLIIATPTGSTAYALSAGGPILHPGLNALVLVPLNPHTLSNRPIVIDENAEIEIEFSQAKQINAQITCDHLQIPDVLISDKIVIKKIEKPIKILHPEDHDFFHILRSKLNWSGVYPSNPCC